jgi:hypothetical protein
MKAIWISLLSFCLGGAIFGYLPKAALVVAAVLIGIAACVAWIKAPQHRSYTPTAGALNCLALMMAAQAEWGIGSLANTVMVVVVLITLIAAVFCAGFGTLSEPRKPNVG